MRARAEDNVFRAARLAALFLLFQSPSSHTTAELAEMYGVHQRTIQRDLLALQYAPFNVPLYNDERRWYRL
jgi:predicted DNA-binding transcriptional regulator YafY